MEEIKNKKILLVDDEAELLEMTEGILRREGFYRIFTAQTCKEALTLLHQQRVSLCVFDVMLPDGDGFSLLQKLQQFSEAPVIFLTAKGEAEDKILGLGLGADDYIVKPFLPKELVLRLTALLRRVYMKQIDQSVSSFRLGAKKVNLESAEVEDAGMTVSLTAKEFILLKKLYENKNKIVTNDALCQAAWGDDYYGYENTLMVHIRRLREKIEKTLQNPVI